LKPSKLGENAKKRINKNSTKTVGDDFNVSHPSEFT
jgi:hypothetical protein